MRVFQDMSTSWVISGTAGRTGLRYEALPFFLEVNGIPREEWRDVTYGIRVMEKTTLELDAERRG